VEKFFRARQATDDTMAHVHCMLNTFGYKYITTICNTYRFSTTTMVARTHYVKCTLPVLFSLTISRRSIPVSQKELWRCHESQPGKKILLSKTSIPVRGPPILQFKSTEFPFLLGEEAMTWSWPLNLSGATVKD